MPEKLPLRFRRPAPKRMDARENLLVGSWGSARWRAPGLLACLDGEAVAPRGELARMDGSLSR